MKKTSSKSAKQLVSELEMYAARLREVQFTRADMKGALFLKVTLSRPDFEKVRHYLNKKDSHDGNGFYFNGLFVKPIINEEE